MLQGLDRQQMTAVALLAEGVDRNQLIQTVDEGVVLSPSSRRAWIEIVSLAAFIMPTKVALLAEGVDRNLGGGFCQDDAPLSPSSRWAWIEI